MNIDQIAMCYLSMDSSQRAIQSNKKNFFFKFQISFQNFDQKPKNIQTNGGVNIDQSEMYYI